MLEDHIYLNWIIRQTSFQADLRINSKFGKQESPLEKESKSGERLILYSNLLNKEIGSIAKEISGGNITREDDSKYFGRQ